MQRSPYEVLGISESATPDEIKKAYRKKARESHPDLHPDDPTAVERMNEVNEAYDRLMNPEKYERSDRVSARYQAHSECQQPNGYYGYSGWPGQGGPYGAPQGSRNGASHGGQRQSYAGPYVWTSGFGFDFDEIFGRGFSASQTTRKPSAVDSAEVQRAIECINARRYSEALSLLNAIPSSDRDARWHYLAALANYGAGNEMLALDQIRRACAMDPNNMGYRRVMQAMRQPSASYRQQAEQRGFKVGAIDPFMACCGCIALQSCCLPSLCFRPF